MKSITPIAYLGLCLILMACEASPSNESQELVEEDSTVLVVERNAAINDSVTTSVPKQAADPTIHLSQDLKLVGKAQGDLTKDGAEEQVFVVEPSNTDQESGEAPPRRVQIYHQKGETWQLWQEIAGGILPADAGGMLGDPFQEVRIERGALVVEHFGGSRIRWNYKHRFRWQNEQWQLIGATIVYGAPCDYWHTYDYNLSIDKVVAKWEVENCDTEETTEENFTFRHRIQPLPNMVGFIPGDMAVPVPERDTEVYF